MSAPRFHPSHDAPEDGSGYCIACGAGRGSGSPADRCPRPREPGPVERRCTTGEPWPVHVYDGSGTMLCGAVNHTGKMIEGSPDTFRRYPVEDRCAGCAERLGKRDGIDETLREVERLRAELARRVPSGSAPISDVEPCRGIGQNDPAGLRSRE